MKNTTVKETQKTLRSYYHTGFRAVSGCQKNMSGWVRRDSAQQFSDEVYVTFENPKGERFCNHLSFQNGKLSGFDQSTIDAFYKGSKPIAWMPLPEPYRGEQE